MKKLLVACLAALFTFTGAAASQQQDTNSAKPEGAAVQKKRAPVFRATKEQIKQAQTLLKSRGLYAGEASGKIDEPLRAALRKYQEAEGLKVTGTLNGATLQKMSVPLTDRQKEILAAQAQQKAG
jgi:peptidoglycan hydrolase-like protein with peptidoglycan-binding domain